ncbi:MAG: extracellular solute-binding protein [Fuerstiella sp.]
MSVKQNTFLVPLVLVTAAAAGLALLVNGGRTGGGDARLVVYCAHDAAYAQSVIDLFERQTGINVDVRFDEEANKSLGLTNLLIAEKDNPRCDVFWNNQTLGTVRLMSDDVLQPYLSPNADRIPSAFKDAGGNWTGFAARLRVYLVNTDQMAATEAAVAEKLSQESLSRVAIAKPQFGTTLSHYSVIAAEQGMDELQAWHQDIHRRGIREARGNSMTKDLVAEGICDLSFTDTDDAFVAIDDGKPVSMLPVRLQDGRTICLPNSVALIRGCSHPEPAKAFIDFLLSEEVELLLAQSKARQIPLGPVDESQLPAEVQELRVWAADGADLIPAGRVNQQVLDWLTAEHTGG